MTLTVQELINELSTIKDKTQEVYIYAYPEWDDCAFNIPICKDDIEKSHFDIKLKRNITSIQATCQTEDVDGSDEDENID